MFNPKEVKTGKRKTAGPHQKAEKTQVTDEPRVMPLKKGKTNSIKEEAVHETTNGKKPPKLPAPGGTRSKTQDGE